jgi:hypothetical protein
VTRPLLALCILALVALSSCDPSTCPTALQAIVQAFNDHTTEKIPLNTQSDCSGASRVPLNDPQSLPGTSAPAPFCYVGPTDPPCLACVGAQCCGVIDQACGPDGGAPSLVACGTDVAVMNCILTARTSACATACNTGDSGAGGGGS